jgi:hypothetical protein
LTQLAEITENGWLEELDAGAVVAWREKFEAIAKKLRFTIQLFVQTGQCGASKENSW